MTSDSTTRWLNPFDLRIEHWLNHFVGYFPRFDKAVLYCDSTNLTTSAAIVFLVWLAVFDARRPGRLRDRHEMIFASVFFAMLAALVARGIAFLLPFRARPIATPALDFIPPAGGSMALIHWSAFPSDHAALLFGIAVSLLMVSRRIGWLAVSWAVIFVGFARLYLGIHWPTDILAGAAIGVTLVQLARIPSVRAFTRRNIENLYQRRPALFLAIFFLWTYEATFLFEDVRRALFFFAKVVPLRA
jgi:membrane-associated phospholipid phosphatase